MLHKLDLDPKATHLKIKYFGELRKEDGTGHGPATMSWKPKSAFSEYKEGEPKPAAQPEKLPPLAKDAPPAKAAAAAAAPPVPPVASTRHAPKKPAPPQPTRELTAAEKARAPDVYATREPKHTIVHRGVGGDLQAAWGDAKVATNTARPAELVVRVELPELSSAAGVDLDITEKMLCLAAPKASYALRLPLPYEVRSGHGCSPMHPGCSPVHPRLQPRAPEAATPCTRGCNPMHPRCSASTA